MTTPMPTLRDVVAEARAWVGTPYQHQQRLRGVAVDCVGLVIGVARALGLCEPGFDFNGYGRAPDGRTMLDECDALMTRVQASAIRPGHVLVLRYVNDPQHMAIAADYLHGGLSMVHALGTRDGKGRVLEQRFSSEISDRLVQVYALPGVDEGVPA